MIKQSLKRIIAILKRIYYFGHQNECPLCKSHVRRFLPFGLEFPVLKQKEVVGAGSRNAQCPVCGCIDRERLLYLYLLHQTDIFQKPQKLLHIAPEPSLSKIFRDKLGKDYLAADLFPKDFMVKMDITDIQFPANTFDAIICSHVLEHIPDDHKAMGELYRVLKPGGWAILQVPISLSLKNTYEDFTITSESARAEAFGQKDHVRIYAKDYKDRLEQVGFKVEVFHWNDGTNLFGNSNNKFRLNEKEDIYIAYKIC
jgi:SAM-dependent methyltransferase